MKSSGKKKDNLILATTRIFVVLFINMEREVAILFLTVLIGLAYQQWDLEKKNQSLSEELSVLKDKIKYLESVDLGKCAVRKVKVKVHVNVFKIKNTVFQ